MEEEIPYECTACGLVFKTEAELLKHVEEVHSQ